MSHRGRILIVADEVGARTALTELLESKGFEVQVAADALKALGKAATFAPHVIVTDLEMPGMDGIELVRKLRELENPPEMIVMVGLGEVKTAVEAMRAGAAEYLTKPINSEELLVVLGKVLEHQHLKHETHQLRQRVRDRVAPLNIVGSAPPMQRVFEIIDQVAPSRANVLITGESGTGKELVANAIHMRSPRATGPFVKLHCAALSDTLIESELFGHERGSFMGAMARTDGRCLLADGGTLFLDEIGEVSPAIQIKLVRFLQDHELERLGGTETFHVDVRVIAATNRMLLDEIGKGRFREDLYYELDVVALEMPSLRERRTDIPDLAKFFVDRYAHKSNKVIAGCSPVTLELLMNYQWPGNVRELENAIERAVALSPGPLLEPKYLPPSIKPTVAPTAMPPIPGATMADLERYAILETMKATGSTSRAAEMLGISSRTIQYRLHDYNAVPRSHVEAIRRPDNRH